MFAKIVQIANMELEMPRNVNNDILVLFSCEKENL